MHLIGLTGGICTGKSFVLSILAELGCYTLRADELARSIIFSDQSPVADEIKAVFGPDILDDQGELDKEKFGRLLFQDAEKRARANALVHPLVAGERAKKIHEIEQLGIHPLFVYESALLVESGICGEFKKIIVVYCSTKTQISRLMARDRISRREAETRIRAQFPLREKLKAADYSIDTSLGFETARANTQEVYHLLRQDLNLV